MQTHAWVCEENKLEEKNNCPLKYFVVRGSTLKECQTRVGNQSS